MVMTPDRKRHSPESGDGGTYPTIISNCPADASSALHSLRQGSSCSGGHILSKLKGDHGMLL